MRIKPRDASADAAYYEEFKIITDKARRNMEMFDEMPASVRHALTQEMSGAISIDDVRRFVGKFPDEILAQAVIENGRVAYQIAMDAIQEENDARIAQRVARSQPVDAPPPVRPKKKLRAKKPRS